ncbi:MAG: outer membrane beta-barrel protein [Myxococcota bacterium]|nr:outer membrane beta-barrel protein [Myxococcota bacterium]
MAAGLLLFSQSAFASDVEAELRQMQDRIAQLEGQLESGTAPLQERESGSGLGALIENTDINGWAAASYNYNFEGFENSAGTANNRPTSHGTSNSFQIDQAWISIDNPADENGRAGAHLDLTAGAAHGGGAGIALYEASISYLAPIGDGIMVEGGIMPTLIGAEVDRTNANFNVTRGIVWDLQPTLNTGARLSTNLTDEVSVTLGVLNDQATRDLLGDTDNEKAIAGQVAWAGEDCGASFNFSWGDNRGDVNRFIGDVVLTYDGMEDVSMWFDYTVVSDDDGVAEGETHGIAAAARLALADDMGVAVRGEAVIVDNDALETETYSLTVTGDKSLTDHLTAKAEVRLDFDADDGLPDDKGAAGEDVAALILAQLIYEF